MTEPILLPSLDYTRCDGDGCGQCAERCPVQALVMVSRRPQILADGTCSYCGICEEICAKGAIALAYEIVFL